MTELLRDNDSRQAAVASCSDESTGQHDWRSHLEEASDRGERRWTLTDALFLGLISGCTLPAVLVRYPLSADYLNHLARLHILASSPDAPIRQYYEIHWSLIPNLAVDLLWAVLHPVASPEAVMKGALIGAIVALGLSVWFLHRSIFRRTQPTILLCALCLLNLPITAGMINFAMGLPLVFLALGCWIRMGGEISGRSLLLLNALGVVAYFAHIAVLAGLVLTVAAYHCLQQPVGARAALIRAAQLMPGLLLPGLLVVAGAIDGWQGGTVQNGAPIAFSATKLFTPLAAFFTGRTAADVATLCATAALVIICRGPINPRLRSVLVVWTSVIVAVPSSIGTAAYIDARLAVIPVMIYLSSMAFQPRLVPVPVFAALATGLSFVRVLTLTPSWQLHDVHVRSFRAVDDRIPRGARVIVTAATPAGCASDDSWSLLEEHLPSLLSIDRDAFVSTVFAGDGIQPIRWKLNLRGTGWPNITAPSLTVLAKIATSEGKAQPTRGSPDVLQSVEIYGGWLEHYDYLAMRDCLPERAPMKYLLLVAHSDTYRIYKIVRSQMRPRNDPGAN
jgi:hypothetical protein